MSYQYFAEKCEPAVPKYVHYIIAGLAWLGVGIMLSNFAIQWLIATVVPLVWIYGLIGTIAGFIIYYFGFSHIAKKNVKRIVEKRHKFCVFAFISWKSYFTILIMVAMGIGLRMSPIPKHYLAILYIGLGIGLSLSSFVYFGKTILHFRNNKKQK
ncbi:MAG: hypothetical protein ACTSRR_08955 [Candidatus Heimdallarchaeaceae archaeon]